MGFNTTKALGYWLFATGLCLIISSYINIEEGLSLCDNIPEHKEVKENYYKKIKPIK